MQSSLTRNANLGNASDGKNSRRIRLIIEFALTLIVSSVHTHEMRAVSTWSFDRVVSSRPSSHATRVLRNEERWPPPSSPMERSIPARKVPSVDPYRPLTITREVIKLEYSSCNTSLS